MITFIAEMTDYLAQNMISETIKPNTVQRADIDSHVRHSHVSYIQQGYENQQKLP
jgi:hypothetical protein